MLAWVFLIRAIFNFLLTNQICQLNFCRSGGSVCPFYYYLFIIKLFWVSKLTGKSVRFVDQSPSEGICGVKVITYKAIKEPGTGEESRRRVLGENWASF